MGVDLSFISAILRPDKVIITDPPLGVAVLDKAVYTADAGPNTVSTVVADMTNVTVSVTVKRNALILLTMQVTTVHSTAGSGGYVVITNAANTAKTPVGTHVLAVDEYQTITLAGYDAVAAGTHTYKGRFYCYVGGTFSTYYIRLQAVALAA